MTHQENTRCINKEAINYIKKYYPTIRTEKDFHFQELNRIQVAREFNDQDGPSGWHALNLIEKNYATADITNEFKSFITDEIKKVDKKCSNVRRQVKNIWTYPLKEYLPWQTIDSKEKQSVLDNANKIIKKLTPEIKII